MQYNSHDWNAYPMHQEYNLILFATDCILCKSGSHIGFWVSHDRHIPSTNENSQEQGSYSVCQRQSYS